MVESLHAVASERDIPGCTTCVSNQWQLAVTPEQFSKQWNIALSQAQQTIKVTTQHSVQSAILPLRCWYQTDRMYKQQKVRGQQLYTAATLHWHFDWQIQIGD
jgi:hypothetical protein